MELEWVVVPGGACRFGDDERPVPVPALSWTRTPVTHDHLRAGSASNWPVTGIDQPTAAVIAARLGGRLPRSVEWEWMAAGPHRRRFPWGDTDWCPTSANLRDTGIGAPSRVGAYPDGATPDGILDVAGNVWEWTASAVVGGGFVIRGGSYASPALYARTTFLNAAPAELRSSGIGLRVVRQP